MARISERQAVLLHAWPVVRVADFLIKRFVPLMSREVETAKQWTHCLAWHH